MLQTITNLFFISISLALIYIIGFISLIELDFKNNNYIIYIISVIFISVFDKLFEYIKSDSNFSIKLNSDFLFKIIVFFIVLWAIIYSKDFWFFNLAIISSIFIWILFAIEERYYFLVAFILLLYVIVFLMFKDNKTAEILSINLYYFLVIWVIISIINSSLNKKIVEEKSEKIKSLIFFKNQKKYLRNIFNISFIIYALLILVFLFFKNYQIIKYLSIIFIFLYFLWKFFWFKINFKRELQNKNNINIWKWIFISSIYSLILVKFTLNTELNIYFSFILISNFLLSTFLFVNFN